MYDFEDTYHWLRWLDECDFLYRIRLLIYQMHAKVEAGEISAAYGCLASIKDALGLTDIWEQAYALMECARALLKMNNPVRAERELREAISLLESNGVGNSECEYCLAMARWMLGNVQLLHTQPSAAAPLWAKSQTAFGHLSNSNSFPAQDPDWYKDRSAEMEQAISDAECDKITGKRMLRATLQAGRLDFIDILEKIPDGGFDPDGVDSVRLGRIMLQPSLKDFHILGELHHLYNLRGPARIISLNSELKYFALKVCGTSMNMVGIEPGNYVLLRYQNHAEYGDIIAAVIVNENSQATLKSYLWEGNTVILQPQSKESFWKPKYYGIGVKEDFHIHGVVLGVFRPVPEKPPQPLPTLEAAAAAEHKPPQKPTYEEVDAHEKLRGHILQFFPIFEKIPAGGPKAIPERTGSYLEADHFWIDGWCFRMKSLRGERTVKVKGGCTVVLKVTGDSMNQAGIEDGDYVLLCWQPTADSGDIVAAEIRGVDDLATLKRYSRRNGKVILSPESTNPDHEEREFAPPKPGEEPPFYIQGIAVAVFKPCEKDAHSEEGQRAGKERCNANAGKSRPGVRPQDA